MPPPTTHFVEITVTAGGDIADYGATRQQQLISLMAALLAVPIETVSLTVTAASVRLLFKVDLPSAGATY